MRGCPLVQSFAAVVPDPEYHDPVSPSDWFAVVSFSAALFALALALPMLTQLEFLAIRSYISTARKHTRGIPHLDKLSVGGT